MTEQLIGCNGSFHRYQRAAATENLSTFIQIMCAVNKNREGKKGEKKQPGKAVILFFFFFF